MPASNKQQESSRLQPFRNAIICFAVGSLLVLAGSLLAFGGFDKQYFALKAGFGLQLVSFVLFILSVGKPRRQ